MLEDAFSYCKEYNEVTAKNRSEKSFSSDLGVVIGSITGSKKLINYALEAESKGGKLNMCNALEEWEEECRQKGLIQGRLELRQINELYQSLMDSNRIDDMKRAFSDEAFRKQLLQEFELQAK